MAFTVLLTQAEELGQFSADHSESGNLAKWPVEFWKNLPRKTVIPSYCYLNTAKPCVHVNSAWPSFCCANSQQQCWKNHNPLFLSVLISTPIEPRNPNADSCWPRIPRVSTTFGAAVFFKLSYKWWKLTTATVTSDLINRQIRSMSPWVHFSCRWDQHYWMWACLFRT